MNNFPQKLRTSFSRSKKQYTAISTLYTWKPPLSTRIKNLQDVTRQRCYLLPWSVTQKIQTRLIHFTIFGSCLILNVIKMNASDLKKSKFIIKIVSVAAIRFLGKRVFLVDLQGLYYRLCYPDTPLKVPCWHISVRGLWYTRHGTDMVPDAHGYAPIRRKKKKSDTLDLNQKA